MRRRPTEQSPARAALRFFYSHAFECSGSSEGLPLVRIGFGRPPASVRVARDSGWIEQCRPAVREGVVGTPVVPEGAGVLLCGAVEAATVRIADLLPDPPTIIGPDFENVAVPVAEQNELRWRFHIWPASHIVF